MHAAPCCAAFRQPGLVLPLAYVSLAGALANVMHISRHLITGQGAKASIINIGQHFLGMEKKALAEKQAAELAKMPKLDLSEFGL